MGIEGAMGSIAVAGYLAIFCTLGRLNHSVYFHLKKIDSALVSLAYNGLNIHIIRHPESLKCLPT